MTSSASNRGSALLFYARESSWREAIGLLLWRPFVCRLRGHKWQEHKWYENEGEFLSEHWRDCSRCERYEDLFR